MSREMSSRVITIFSSQGTLQQVENTFLAIKACGLTSIAICGKDCAVVITQKKVPDKLMKPDTITTLYKLDESIGCCVTGRMPDGRSIVNDARQEAFEYLYDRGVPIPVATLAKRIADTAQIFTQNCFVRAMGVATTIIGMDRDDETGLNVPRVYKTDPAGHFVGYFATASGTKEVEAVQALEKKMRADKKFGEMDERQVKECCLDVLSSVLDEALKAGDVEMAAVTKANPKFHRIPDNEIEEMLTAIAERDEPTKE